MRSLRRVAVPSAQCCARRAMKLSFRLHVKDSAMSPLHQFDRLEPVADPPGHLIPSTKNLPKCAIYSSQESHGSNSSQPLSQQAI